MNEYGIEKDNLTIVERRLKSLRLKKHLTQRQAAKVLHVTRHLISEWENGYFDISLSQLVKIASLYSSSLDYILGITDNLNEDYDYLYINKLDLKYVGIKIREIRKKEKLTQEEFASMLFTKRSNISYYEIGKKSITTADLKGICETFGVSADYITGNILEPITREKVKKMKPEEVKNVVNS